MSPSIAQQDKRSKLLQKCVTVAVLTTNNSIGEIATADCLDVAVMNEPLLEADLWRR